MMRTGIWGKLESIKARKQFKTVKKDKTSPNQKINNKKKVKTSKQSVSV